MQRGLCPYASKTSLSSLSIPPPVFPLSRLCRGDKEYPTRNYLFPLFVDLFLVCLFSPSRLFFFFFPRAQSGPQLSKYLLNESCPLIGYKCPRGLERLNNFLQFMLLSQEHRSPPEATASAILSASYEDLWGKLLPLVGRHSLLTGSSSSLYFTPAPTPRTLNLSSL